MAKRLYQQLQAARIAMGWTQADVAERIGITQAAVSAVERGHREASMPVIERWAECLGMEVIAARTALEVIQADMPMVPADDQVLLSRLISGWNDLPEEHRTTLRVLIEVYLEKRK